MDKFEAAKTGTLDWFVAQQHNGCFPDLTEQDTEFNQVYEYAAYHGHLKLLKYFAEDCPQKDQVDLSISDNILIHRAIRNGHLDVVKYLVEECPQKEQIQNDLQIANNLTVRFAISAGHLYVVKYLFEECAQKDQIDLVPDNNHAIHSASREGHLSVIKYLFEECPQKANVDICARDTDIVRQAVLSYHLDIIQYLFDECPQRNQIDITFSNNWIFKQLTIQGSLESIQYLFEECSQSEKLLHSLTPELFHQVIEDPRLSSDVYEYLAPIAELFNLLTSSIDNLSTTFLDVLGTETEVSLSQNFQILQNIPIQTLEQLLTSENGRQQILNYLREQCNYSNQNTLIKL